MPTNTNESSMGAVVARLKWQGLVAWKDIYERYPKHRQTKIRSAARRYKRLHPNEFPASLSQEPKSTFEESGNYAEAQSDSQHISTLEQLIEVCNIDMTVWNVQKWGIGRKSWEMGAKVIESDLTFDEGKISGWKKQGGIGKVPLEGWTIWANFIRKEIIPIYPTIQPITCTVTYVKPPIPSGNRLCKSLIFADPQIGFMKDTCTAHLEPFHDRCALDIVLQLAQVIQPDRIDCLGDLLDFAEWTDKFVREPEFINATQPAILEANWWLTQLRMACPGAAIGLHEGNHEQRMRRQLLLHLRCASDLRAADEMDLPPALSPERLLALHELGIEWYGDYPNDASWLGKGLKLSHGDIARNEPGATTAAIIKKANTSEIVGHIHRREMASRTIYIQDKPRTITAYCPGCTCSIDGVVPGVRAQQQWQQGIAIVEYNPEGHQVTRHDIEIVDGIAIYNGIEYTGRDTVNRLRSDLPKWGW